jgi:hypothetical protein
LDFFFFFFFFVVVIIIIFFFIFIIIIFFFFFIIIFFIFILSRSSASSSSDHLQKEIDRYSRAGTNNRTPALRIAETVSSDMACNATDIPLSKGSRRHRRRWQLRFLIRARPHSLR